MRNDAPEFANGREAVEWMEGKVTSAPHGACTDRFARLAFQKAGIEPKRYLNQNIEVITTNFRAGKLDAAAIWEPTASKIVMGGIARRAASGEDFDALDGGFMVMLNDLIEQRPDVHRGWLEAELDALLPVEVMVTAASISCPKPPPLPNPRCQTQIPTGCYCICNVLHCPWGSASPVEFGNESKSLLEGELPQHPDYTLFDLAEGRAVRLPDEFGGW